MEDPVTLRALELLGFKDEGLTVYLRHDLPLGSGFGISGASALAACMELEKNLDLCVKAAHQAEVEFRTGLGDVIAIAESIRTNLFPSIVVRQTPGYGGETQSFVWVPQGLDIPRFSWLARQILGFYLVFTCFYYVHYLVFYSVLSRVHRLRIL